MEAIFNYFQENFAIKDLSVAVAFAIKFHQKSLFDPLVSWNVFAKQKVFNMVFLKCVMYMKTCFKIKKILKLVFSEIFRSYEYVLAEPL